LNSQMAEAADAKKLQPDLRFWRRKL
jgi:hypothetical protein